MCASSFAEVREPAVSGQFYPADKDELVRIVDDFLARVPESPSNEPPVALIAPHAGYMFSGSVAAYSYKLLAGKKIDAVIIIGVAHSYPLSGAAIYPKGSFRTPLGDMTIDEEIAQKLMQVSPDIKANSAAHEGEHSIETQIPFLQRVLPDSKIVPVLMGNPDLATAKRIGEAVAKVIIESTKKIVLIASTDMAHYPNAKDANESDFAILKTIEDNDPNAVVVETSRLMSKGFHELHCTLCGEGATLAVMSAAKKLGINHSAVLKHATSADSPYGDTQKTVGYCAVAFFKNENEESFSKEEEKKLIEIARSAITRQVLNSDDSSRVKDSEFIEKRAVFVTLMKDGELRGCIGGIEPQDALSVAVEKAARAAATKDPRFPAVTKEELAKIKIEISVLSPIRRIKNADEIVPYEHGVIIEHGAHHGLFLPQVWEHVHGDKERFMNLLSVEKAGLPINSWKDESAQLSVFEVTSFSEE